MPSLAACLALNSCQEWLNHSMECMQAVAVQVRLSLLHSADSLKATAWQDEKDCN